MSVFVRQEVYEANKSLRNYLQLMHQDNATRPNVEMEVIKISENAIVSPVDDGMASIEWMNGAEEDNATEFLNSLDEQVGEPGYTLDEVIGFLNSFRPGDFVLPTAVGKDKDHHMMKYFTLKPTGSGDCPPYAARRIDKIFMRELKYEIMYYPNDNVQDYAIELPLDQNVFYEWSIIPSEPMTENELKKYFPTQYSLANRIVCEFTDDGDAFPCGIFVSLARDDRFEDNGEDCGINIGEGDVTLVSKIMKRSAMQYVVNREVGARIGTQDYRVRRTKRALKNM